MDESKIGDSGGNLPPSLMFLFGGLSLAVGTRPRNLDAPYRVFNRYAYLAPYRVGYFLCCAQGLVAKRFLLKAYLPVWMPLVNTLVGTIEIGDDAIAHQAEDAPKPVMETEAFPLLEIVNRTAHTGRQPQYQTCRCSNDLDFIGVEFFFPE